MRSAMLVLSLAFTGCQLSGRLGDVSSTSAIMPAMKIAAHRPAPTDGARGNSPVAQTASAAQPAVQQVQHVELVPAPEPETLPPATLKPVELGKLTLADLEQVALAGNPSVARAAALV